MNLDFTKSDFRQQLETELTRNILPFWMNYVVDRETGGFHGALTNDLKILHEVPRASVLCSRILWTYSRAYYYLKNELYLPTAKQIFEYFFRIFWDPEYGGIFWDADNNGKPVCDYKHNYTQAFAIYSLSEYFRATEINFSLEIAQKLFYLLEKYAYDCNHGGYFEGSHRNWDDFKDIRLSEKDLPCRKSMNTLLHVLEAYTNLLTVWQDEHLKKQHRNLIEIFLEKVINHQTHHLILFFDEQWRSLSNLISYGHDIEASWLLQEAAKVQEDADLLKRVYDVTIQMAEAVMREGMDKDGSIFYEGSLQGITDASKEWWVQGEAVVGFYNAYQITAETHFATAAHRLWTFIQDKLIDHQYGDWYKKLNQDGTPDYNRYKAGPWECPYHHSRMCFELMTRLKEE